MRTLVVVASDGRPLETAAPFDSADPKKGDRVVTNLGTLKEPAYFSGTVTQVSKAKGQIRISYDDGDVATEGVDNKGTGLIGFLKGKKAYKKAIPMKTLVTLLDADRWMVPAAKKLLGGDTKAPVSEPKTSGDGDFLIVVETVLKRQGKFHPGWTVLDRKDSGLPGDWPTTVAYRRAKTKPEATEIADDLYTRENSKVYPADKKYTREHLGITIADATNIQYAPMRRKLGMKVNVPELSAGQLAFTSALQTDSLLARFPEMAKLSSDKGWLTLLDNLPVKPDTVGHLSPGDNAAKAAGLCGVYLEGVGYMYPVQGNPQCWKYSKPGFTLPPKAKSIKVFPFTEDRGDGVYMAWGNGVELAEELSIEDESDDTVTGSLVAFCAVYKTDLFKAVKSVKIEGSATVPFGSYRTPGGTAYSGFLTAVPVVSESFDVGKASSFMLYQMKAQTEAKDAGRSSKLGRWKAFVPFFVDVETKKVIGKDADAIKVGKSFVADGTVDELLSKL